MVFGHGVHAVVEAYHGDVEVLSGGVDEVRGAYGEEVAVAGGHDHRDIGARKPCAYRGG